MHNLGVLRQRGGLGTRVLAAVKADAYGHGAVPVARALSAAGCDAFGVATVEEGLALRAAGLTELILLFSGAGRLGADAAVAADLTCVVYEVGALHRLNAAARRAERVVPVHLKVDTGMGRLGVLPDDWSAFVDAVEACDNLHIDGVLTHLAAAEDDGDGTDRQVALFDVAVAQVHARGHRPTFIHADNSAGVMRHTHGYGLIRPGIGLYGASGDSVLRPVLSLHSEVHSLRTVPTGTPISYGGTWVSPRPSRLAVLPIGYADGYPRALSGCADVLIHGQRATIRGRVCMDLIMVDVTDIAEPVCEGTPVVLIGDQGSERITAEDLAHRAGTISYEVLAGLTARVPRHWVQS